MRRWLVVLFVGVTLVVVAVVVALRNAEAWIEKNRDWITARVQEAVGRPVSFGAVSVSAFPTVAVRVADVWIGNDPRWPDAPLLVADSARVAVAILPALVGRIAVRRVDVESPVITVFRDERGGETARRPPAAPPRRPQERGTTTVDEAVAMAQAVAARVAGLPLAVGTARIVDGRVRLLEERGGRKAVFEATDVDATASGIGGNRPARLEARAALFESAEQNVTFDGTIGPFDEAAPGRTPIEVELGGEALDLARLRAALPELASAVPAPLRIEGPLDAGASVKGVAEAPAFEARLDATRAKVAWAEWFAKPAGTAFTMTAEGTRAGTGARLERFVMRLAELAVNGRGDVSPERLALHVEAEPTDLRSLAALLPGLGARRLDGDFGFALDATGAVTAERTPGITGTVTLRDVAVASDDPGTSITGLTQTIALRGDTAVLPPTSLRVGGSPVTVSGRVERFTEPVMRLADLDVRIFGGRVAGGAELDRRPAAGPRFTTALTLHDLDVAAALAMRSREAARSVSGRLSGRMSLRGGERLDGEGDFAVANGMLRGVNLVERVLAGVTRVPGLTAMIPPRVRDKHPTLFGGEDTRFDELTAVWRLAGEVTHLDRVALAAEGYALEGRGTVAGDERLDATAVLELSDGVTRDLVQATEVAALLKNPRGRIAIPFALDGTWPRVRVTPDVGGITQSLQRGAVQQGLERLLGEGLRRLQKR